MLRSFQTPLSRNNQWVDAQASTSTMGAHQVKPASTTAEATPATVPTRLLAMKSRFRYIGGPVIPRSNSREVVRSSASSGSSRWPMPGGSTQLLIRRSFSQADSRLPRFMLTAVRIGPTISISTKTTPTKARVGPSGSELSTARIVTPVATAKTAGSAPLSTSRIHQAAASPA